MTSHPAAAAANELPPAKLAAAARKVARDTGLRCRVMDTNELKRRKMGGILAVGAGSSRPPRLIVLEHGAERTFEPFDRFAPEGEPLERPLEDLLSDFARLRRRNLAELDGLHLCEADLDRQGRHPDFGPITLRELLATWTAHDLAHLAQITRTMAHQCAPLVGPWRAYFREMGTGA